MNASQRDRQAGQTSGTSQRPPRQHAAPILTFDVSAELERLRNEESFRAGDRGALTLVKYQDLRIVLTALRAGTTVREHHAPGPVSVHTIDGRLRLHADGQSIDLPTGHVLTFGAGVAHDVEAVEESAFLLTVAWPRDGADAD